MGIGISISISITTIISSISISTSISKSMIVTTIMTMRMMMLPRHLRSLKDLSMESPDTPSASSSTRESATIRKSKQFQPSWRTETVDKQLDSDSKVSRSVVDLEGAPPAGGGLVAAPAQALEKSVKNCRI